MWNMFVFIVQSQFQLECIQIGIYVQHFAKKESDVIFSSALLHFTEYQRPNDYFTNIV